MLLALVISGCNKSAAENPDADKKMRDAFTGTFDPNKVPPEHRAKVEGFMKMGGQDPSAGNAKPAASAAGAAPAAAPDKPK